MAALGERVGHVVDTLGMLLHEGELGSEQLSTPSRWGSTCPSVVSTVLHSRPGVCFSRVSLLSGMNCLEGGFQES